MQSDQQNQQNQQNTNSDPNLNANLEENSREQRLSADQAARNESGLPGGGVGRMETPGHTGIYPLSADQGASSDAPVQGEEAFGQGARGAAGYQDSGDSEIIPAKELGGDDEDLG